MKQYRRENIIEALCLLGQDIEKNKAGEDYRQMYSRAVEHNHWFNVKEVQYALEQFVPWLERETLNLFCKNYPTKQNPTRLAIVCAGNIPAVGFHDILCALLMECKTQVKLSSADDIVIPFLIDKLKKEIDIKVDFVEKIRNYDAVIATGSNNSAIYFNTYFASVPHIVRHSRSSLAVVTDKDDISGIEDDLFLYKGLGCRNPSLLFLPTGYNIDLLKQRAQKYRDLASENKYRNNYDYHKAMCIINETQFDDGGFFLMKEEKELYSPLSVISYCYYKDLKEVQSFIETHRDEIQCVVADKAEIENVSKVAFGSAQSPAIWDFADNTDTMKFIAEC